AITVQIVFGPFGARERPLILVAPDVLAHHENAHWCSLVDAVLDSFQPVVKPPEPIVINIYDGSWSKFNLTKLRSRIDSVWPRTYHESLAAADTLLGFRGNNG